MEYKVEDFHDGNYWYEVLEVKNYKNRVKIIYKDNYRTRNIVIKFIDGRCILEGIIDCKPEELVDTINNLSFLTIENKMNYIKSQKARDRREARAKILQKTIKVGDIVKASKSTYCGRQYILVDQVGEHYLSGFYLQNNGERSNEYVGKSYEYISKIATMDEVIG